jgi:EAL domain-containing protein (putative c-di-GMP-specific phosphodiesterase class I)
MSESDDDYPPFDSTKPPGNPCAGTRRADVLLVDDDELLLRAIERVLTRNGYTVGKALDSHSAARAALADEYLVILSDIQMPGLTGMEMLEMLRGYGSDIPVILMTGAPSLDSARAAVELGAVQYLTKPLDTSELLRAVRRAMTTSRKARDRVVDPHQAAGFDRALGSLWMAFQPIVSLASHGPVAYEALVRSREPGFTGPVPLLDFAERSGRLPELGRAIRELCADAIAHAPRGTSLFVNLHTQDLRDAELFSPSSPLTSYADRVVLEITERGALDEIGDVVERTRRLRSLGYGIAIDDLGAGYSSLSSVAVIEPDYVKLDMSLTRDIGSSPLRKRLIGSMVETCRDTGMKLVAEGVETIRELAALRELGCDLLQGYYFARPSPEFLHPAA